MSTRVDGQFMRDLADGIREALPQGLGFALLVYDHNVPGMANYVSNSQRSDMVTALRECADKLDAGMTFNTPEHR